MKHLLDNSAFDDQRQAFQEESAASLKCGKAESISQPEILVTQEYKTNVISGREFGLLDGSLATYVYDLPETACRKGVAELLQRARGEKLKECTSYNGGEWLLRFTLRK